MDGAAVADGAEAIALAGPSLNIDMLINGLGDISPLLATAIPLGIYNFTEAMSNVESAAAAGDSYNLRSVLLADGAGAVVGAGLGSPFPPAVYIGQPGWKAAGGRVSYSLVTGAFIFGLCILGMFPLLSAILPIPAIVPILLFIGLAIGAQSFAAVPKVFYPAIVLAMVPNIAQWATSQIDSALAAAGTTAGEVGFGNLSTAGVIYDGLNTLGQGAILAGMVLGAIAVFMINRSFLWAAGYSLFGAALASVGLIHAPEVAWFDNPEIVLGYTFMAVVCLGFYLLRVPLRELDPADPADTEAPRPDWRPSRLAGGGMTPAPAALSDEGPSPATTT